MAFEKPLLIQSFTAASAMSNSTNQYIFVKLLSAGTVVPCSSAQDCPIGVLQNLPDRGSQAEVLMVGISKLRVGSTDVAGTSAAFVGSDANGRAILAVSGNSATYAAARVIQLDATDNDGALVTAAVNCLSLMSVRSF